MALVRPSYALLLSKLQDKIRERSTPSDVDKAHLQAVAVWLAMGKKELENIKELTQQESEAALAAYFSKKPRRRPGRPKGASTKTLKAALTNRLIAIALTHQPENTDEFINSIADSIRT